MVSARNESENDSNIIQSISIKKKGLSISLNQVENKHSYSTLDRLS